MALVQKFTNNNLKAKSTDLDWWNFLENYKG